MFYCDGSSPLVTGLICRSNFCPLFVWCSPLSLHIHLLHLLLLLGFWILVLPTPVERTGCCSCSFATRCQDRPPSSTGLPPPVRPQSPCFTQVQPRRHRPVSHCRSPLSSSTRVYQTVALKQVSFRTFQIVAQMCICTRIEYVQLAASLLL